MLTGKSVIVTGAGRGTGSVIVDLLAQQGANLVLSDVDEIGVAGKAKMTKELYGIEAIGLVGSVYNVVRLAEAASEIGNGQIWGIVNNAGITQDATISKMSEHQWDLVMNVNLKGAFLTIQKALPFMASGGSIVNMANIVAKVGNVGQVNYCASKAGIIGLTNAVAKECAKNQIRCNAILTGFIATPGMEILPAKVVNNMVDKIPLRRAGHPQDVANAVLFLLSNMSSYITGAVLEVTGGMNMGW